MTGGQCHVCGDTGRTLWPHGETGGITVAPFLVCGQCGGGPVCGDCSTDLGDWIEWADDVASGADIETCVQCGKGGPA